MVAHLTACSKVLNSGVHLPSHPSADIETCGGQQLIRILSQKCKNINQFAQKKVSEREILFWKNSICRDMENYELPVNSTDVRLRVSVTGAFHPLLYFHITLPLEHCTHLRCVVFIRWCNVALCFMAAPLLAYTYSLHQLCQTNLPLWFSWHTCPPLPRANNQCLWPERESEMQEAAFSHFWHLRSIYRQTSNFIPGPLSTVDTFLHLACDKIKKCVGAWTTWTPAWAPTIYATGAAR